MKINCSEYKNNPPPQDPLLSQEPERREPIELKTPDVPNYNKTFNQINISTSARIYSTFEEANRSNPWVLKDVFGTLSNTGFVRRN